MRLGPETPGRYFPHPAKAEPDDSAASRDHCPEFCRAVIRHLRSFTDSGNRHCRAGGSSRTTLEVFEQLGQKLAAEFAHDTH
ncbi:MAG: hypothetical protein R2874_16030 [Desulfobacterales bacterium]